MFATTGQGISHQLSTVEYVLITSCGPVIIDVDTHHLKEVMRFHFSATIHHRVKARSTIEVRASKTQHEKVFTLLCM